MSRASNKRFRRTFACLVAFLVPSIVYAQVARVGEWDGALNFESQGFDYTPEDGCNRIVLVIVSAESNTNPVADVHSVTLGGQTLTAIQNANGIVVGTAGNYHDVLWFGYLDESQIGSMSGNALSVTWDQAPNTPFGEIEVQAATYQFVDQTTEIVSSNSNTNASANSIQAGNISVGANDRAVYAAVGNGPMDHTAPAGYTEQMEQDGPALDHTVVSVERDATSSSTENPTASWSATDRLAIISAAINYDGVGGLILNNHPVAQENDAFSGSGSETDAELYAFELDPVGGSFTVTNLVFTISGVSGLVDGDWAGIEILEDTNDDGDIGGGETTAVGGSGTVNTAGGTITFSTSFSVTTATSYILRADFSSLSEGDQVTIDLTSANITTSGCESGSADSVLHRERACEYISTLETWTATSAGAWQTQSLSGSPYNVPANAIVEVAIRNSNTGLARFGGVRALASSTLDRRVDLHEAESGSAGYDVVTMHAVADGSSQIQHYAENTTDVDFVLLGYWTAVCGTYVEAFDTFTAGADASWQDENLSAYGVGGCEVAEIVIANDNQGAQRQAGVRTDGSVISRLINLHESEGAGGNEEDYATMFVQADGSASAIVEAYAEVDADIDFYHVGYWSTPPGAYVELFSTLTDPTTDATWQDVDLTSTGVIDGAVVEMILGNDADAESNDMGVRDNNSSLSRVIDLHEAESGGEDLVRLHVNADASAVVEYYHEDVSDDHNFYVTGYWDIGGTVQVLADHDAGQETDAFTQAGGETDAELFAFQLNPRCDTNTITQLVFRLTGISGLVDGDWAGIELVVDSNDDGDIGGGEATTVGGSGVVNTAAGTITFSTSFNVSATTHYILRADFASLSDGDAVSIGLSKDDIATTATAIGSATSVTHLDRCSYVEVYETWSASSPDTWELQDLSGAPFNVPANAVVEVAVRSSETGFERWGGVRADGSTLERRFALQEAEAGGYDVVVLHVQADASSEIRHYAEDTIDVDFVLLGYWECGTYVEAFDTFTAGADSTWQDEDLCAFGVGPSHVAEIVMTNDDTTNEREAGVRTEGTSLERRLDLQEAESGGVDTATMMVLTDSSASATVELYAETDANIDFYLVGHWSQPPLAYNQLFADVGSPSSNGTWEDLDLTGSGVTDHGVAEFALANEDAVGQNNMGVRRNGSTISRYLDLQEAEDGGGSYGRMHVRTDETASIEYYFEDLSSTHTFHLTGYWDTCDASISYTVADLGAITASEDSLGQRINASGDVAGFEEDASGDPTCWFSECESFTALGTLGGADGEALGLNDSEMVVGWAHNGSGDRRAFTWTSGGGMVDLGVVDGRSDSEARAVNFSSEVVGQVFDSAGTPNNRLAFIYLPSPAYTLGSGMTSLGTLGGDQSSATDINDSGQVTGGAHEADGDMRPFRWANGTMTNLGTLGGESNTVLHRGQSINSSGNVAGGSYTAGGDFHAFYYDGSMNDLGVLTGGDTSWGLGINDSNVVVGTANTASGFRAFVWDATNGMRNLNDLDGASGWTLIRATDINNNGQITGWGTNGSGDVRAFLLTPTCNAGGGGSLFDRVNPVVTYGSVRALSPQRFVELAKDRDGRPVAEIVILAAEENTVLDYEVRQPTKHSRSAPGPGRGTMLGFQNGKALEQSVHLFSNKPMSGYKYVLSIITSLDDLADKGLSPERVELHILTGSENGRPPRWRPAGRFLGEHLPTNRLGDSGFVVYTDESVDFWTVVDRAGEFALGQRESAGENSKSSRR